MIRLRRLGRTTAFGLATLCATPASAQLRATPADHAWTLEEVLASALAQHPLVEAAQARVEAARGGRVTAGTFQDPVGTIWLENAPFPGQASLPGVSRETSTYFTLPLESFFQRGPRIRSADETIKAVGAELVGQRRQVALDTAHAFYRLAAAQVSLDAADEQRMAAEELVSYNRNRVGAGAAAELELLKVEVELDRATTSVALARIEVARSWADLSPFLGVATAAPLPSDGEPLALPRVRVPDSPAPPPSMTVAELLIRAREQRPEMIEARARVAAASAEAAYQRTLIVRSLGATLGFKQTNGDSTMIAGVSVPLPLFDRNRGNIQRTVSEALAVDKELLWTGRRVEADVRAAYEAARQLSAQTGASHRAGTERAAEVHRITLAAYQEGATSLLQVLDAARTLADTRLMYRRTLLAQQQSAFELALAVGMEPFPSLSIFQAAPPVARESADGGATR